MATKSDSESPVQLPLGDLLTQLDKRPGEAIAWPVSNEDIGGELLSILSRGLYPSPLDCIREYVQNAVDAQAKLVRIKLTGNSVIIVDDGEGMDINGLVEARKFGLSPKPFGEYVGFRGIGLYSGFDICNKLIIETKQAGSERSLLLELDFKGMRDQLDAEKKAQGIKRTPLNELIQQFTLFRTEEVSGQHIARKYTIVNLQDLSDTHISQLADRVGLKKYILRNLPIDFDDEFEHKAILSKLLREHVPGYNAVIIKLELDDLPVEIISRPAIPNLAQPKLGFIKNSKKEQIAYYWASLYEPGTQIPEAYSDYQGFVYKVKGFTIGDNETPRTQSQTFKIGSGTLYRWYTGEIYILDSNVIPNAARDDFETNRAKLQLITAIKETLDDLQNDASQHQKRLRAQKTIQERSKDLDKIEEIIESGQHYVPWEMHTQLDNLVKDLEGQRKAADKQILQSLVQRAEKFKKIVRKEIDSPDEHSKKPISDSPPSIDPKGSLPIPPPIPPPNDGSNKPPPPSTSPETKSQSSKTLLNVIQECGWDLTGGLNDLIQTIDITLADTLGFQSDKYRQVLETLESKLLDNE